METIHYFLSVFRFKTDALSRTQNMLDVAKDVGVPDRLKPLSPLVLGQSAQPGTDVQAWPGLPGVIDVERHSSVSPGFKSTWQRHKRSTSLNLKLPTLPSLGRDLMPQR